MEPIPLSAIETSTQYPSMSDRIQSTFIDMLFIILLMFAGSEIMEKFEHVPDWIRMALFIGMWVIYEPLCTSLGATIGNYIKGIRVAVQIIPLKESISFRHCFVISSNWH